jgi:large subunit ribosomal protein L19
MARQQTYKIIKPEQVQIGMRIRVHQRIKEQTAKGMRERIQVFEGLVLTVRGKEPNKTMTVRKISKGFGVEKIYPLALPSIEKIELVKQFKTRRKNIGFLRKTKKRLRETRAKLRDVKSEAVPEEGTKEEITEADVLPEETPEEEKKQEGETVGAGSPRPPEEKDEPAEEPRDKKSE